MRKPLFGAADIGGTKILAGLCDSDGTVLSKESFRTKTGPGSAEESVKEIVASLKEQIKGQSADISELDGIGIICAGPVDPAKGTVENPYTLAGWEGFPIVESINGLTGVPVKLENDANGVLLGEIAQRKLQDKRVLMITIGTGIGVAAYLNGGLYRTGGRFHPEMGHVIVAENGPECYCRHRGCFESLWSGSAINRRAVELGYSNFDGLFEASTLGEAVAGEFLETAKSEFTRGVWNLMCIMKPDAVILGGGFMTRYFDMAKEWIECDMRGLDDFLAPFTVLKAGGEGSSALTGGTMLFRA